MRISNKKITVIVEKTKTGFSAYADDYPVFTTGSNFTKLSQNMLEALNLLFEEDQIMVTRNNLEFIIDLKQFFQFYRVLNAKYLAERIGINPTLLSQYVQGRKKPSEHQTEKIIAGIQEIGKELSKLRLE